MNVEIGTAAAEFLFWEHINGIFVAVQPHRPGTSQRKDNSTNDRANKKIEPTNDRAA
jgi:hypothetical protein